MKFEKKVGVLGSGIVAQTLGTGFLGLGADVMLGTRDTTKLTEWQKKNEKKALTGGFNETAEFGDIIVLAVTGKVAADVIQQIDEDALKGKIVIDVTNPIATEPPQDGVLKFFTSYNNSLMEQLQDVVPDARFVKAFNSVGSAYMVHPTFKEGKPTMFICGNDHDAKEVVSGILDSFGWEVEDMGTATAARAIEPLCILWCIPGIREGRWSHAFKLLKA